MHGTLRKQKYLTATLYHAFFYNASTGRCIVIAVDDSEHSELAVDFYVNNVYKQGDRIVPVHVPEYGNLITTCSLLTDPNIVQDLLKESEEKTKELMDKYSKKMKERHLSGHVKQRCGKPGEAIIEATKDKGASMLILGSRGKGLVRRTFLGSLVTTVYTIAMFRS